MVPLAKIVKELRIRHEVEILPGHVEGQPHIEQVLFWQPDSVPLPGTLYLAEYREDLPFSGPLLVLGLPEDAAPQHHLYLRGPCDLLQLYNWVQAILYETISANIAKEEMFHVLQAGSGMKALLKVAYAHLGNPITLCDTSFSVLMRVPDTHGTDDLVERDGRIVIKNTSIDSMRSEKLLDKLFHSREPFFVDRDGFSYRWMYCNIRIHEAVVGYVCIQATEHPFTELDTSFVETLAKMLSVEMQKDEFFMKKSGIRYEYYLSDLINGRFSEEEAARTRLSHLGRTFDENLWLLVFFYDKSKALHITSNYFVEQMRAVFPKGMTIIHNGTPVLLTSQKNTELFQPYQWQRLDDFLQFNRMHCAVSYRFTNVLEAAHYFRQLQACDALIDADTERIVLYQDIAIPHLLHIVEKELPLTHFIHPQIRTLLAYDRAHNTEFGKTLRVYLDAGRSTSKTAAILDVHKSTLSYRIGKISEIIGVPLNEVDTHDLFSLSFKIYDYLSK